MIIPADVRVHRTERVLGLLPGTRVPIRVKEAVLFGHGDRTFLAYEDMKDRVLLCAVGDKRFKHTFIVGDSLSAALEQWYENLSQGGDGL